jgi:hypothetical protein
MKQRICGPRRLEYSVLLETIPSFSRKYDETVRRNCQLCGIGQAVKRWPIRVDRPSIAGNDWVYPIIVDVAIEYFQPSTAVRKSDPIVIPGALVEADDHDDI